MSLAALLLVLGLAQATPAEEALGPDALPPVLRLRADELPRADPGRWRAYDGGDVAALDASPEVLALLQDAQRAYLARRYPQALEALVAALRAEPDLPEALSLAGLVWFRLRRYGDAAAAYERLLEVAPRLLGRTLALGHAYYSLGRYPEAQAHYERILALRPHDPDVTRGLALVRMRLGDEDGALVLLEGLVARGEELAEANYWLGRLRFDRGEPERALAHVEALETLAPYDVRAWYLRMQVLADLGREEEARAAEERWREVDVVTQELRKVDALLALQPDRFDLLAGKLDLHARLGDARAVRALVPRLVAARPEDVAEDGLLVHVLDRLVTLDDTEGALGVARRLEERCPESLAGWRRLELLYASLRRRADQVRASRRVRELVREEG